MITLLIKILSKLHVLIDKVNRFVGDSNYYVWKKMLLHTLRLQKWLDGKIKDMKNGKEID